MQSDFPSDDMNPKVTEGESADDYIRVDGDLTAEEWAELERATSPDAPVIDEEQPAGDDGDSEPADSFLVADVPVSDDLAIPTPSAATLGGDVTISAEDAEDAEDAEESVEASHGDQAVVAGSWSDPIDDDEPAVEEIDTETAAVVRSEELEGGIEPLAAAGTEELKGANAEVDPGVSASIEPDTAEHEIVLDDAEDEPASSLSMPLPRVIAVANQKGGVGKTTTTVNIAACLAEQGYRTLLVDLDPQANASTGLGLEPRELEHSIYHVMLHDEEADSCIEPTEIKNLFILPSSLDLAGAEIELVSLLSREHRLRLAIETVIDDYDYVLIDCPPSLGLLTINALTAAREVLVPIQCEYYALEGLGQLMRNVDLVRASLNPTLQISHIVLVMFDPRTKLAGQVVDEVRSHFGSTVCENVIPRTVRLSEAPSFGQPITTFDSQSRGAAAYRAVTQEVLDGQA